MLCSGPPPFESLENDSLQAKRFKRFFRSWFSTFTLFESAAPTCLDWVAKYLSMTLG